MVRTLLYLSFFFFLIKCHSTGDAYLNDTAIVFADSLLASKIVTREDDYTKNLSAYDRSSSLNTNKYVTKKEFLKHLAKNVMAWKKAEKKRFISFTKKAAQPFAKLNLNLPDEIILIKTTSKELGGITVAYTRQNAIMITKNMLHQDDKKLYEIFLHEIYHIYSRFNPSKKKEFYNIIGFRQGNDVSLPEDWNDRRITNPDAPELNTYIDLTIHNEKAPYLPIMYARQPQYNPSKPGGLFQSIGFGLMKVKEKNGKYTPVFVDGNPVLLGLDTKEYWQQIGRNTNYIYNPDEILASNFVFLVTEKDSLPNPEIINSMRKVFTE